MTVIGKWFSVKEPIYTLEGLNYNSKLISLNGKIIFEIMFKGGLRVTTDITPNMHFYILEQNIKYEIKLCKPVSFEMYHPIVESIVQIFEMTFSDGQRIKPISFEEKEISKHQIVWYKLEFIKSFDMIKKFPYVLVREVILNLYSSQP